MINYERVVAVIPARGGSKSVPMKNIRSLGGKPLLAWSVETAKQTTEIDRVIVSTDNLGIGSVATNYGAEVYERPAHLATDEALVIDALNDLYKTLKREGETAEIMVLFEPTCPFRSSVDIRECIIKLVDNDLDSVATFKPAELNPYRAWRIQSDRPEPFIHGANPWQPRQKLPQAFQLNGAVYVFYIARLPLETNSLLFGRTGAIVMPHERSLDIDYEIDFSIAEMILKENL